MTLVVKKIGGSSSRYFIRQQQAIGRTEGFVEEMMNGQKVVKVFCHEQGGQGGLRRHQRRAVLRLGKSQTGTQIC